MRILYTATNVGWQQIGSRLIRAFEGGLASHCGAVLSTGEVIDAYWPAGIKTHTLDEFLASRELIADIHVDLPDEASAERWMLSQVGRKYDVLDILSFLLWRDVGSKTHYVCSNFLLRAKLYGGLNLMERHDRWGVRHDLIHSSSVGSLQ